MSNERSTNNVGNFGGFVNAFATIVIVSLIGAGYFSALGSFAGIA